MEFLVGNRFLDDKIIVKAPFHPDVLNFLAGLSTDLLKSPLVKNYPDIVSFAYWCRRSNLKRQQNIYSSNGDRIGRGIVLHIAPSNVPVNFAFSLAFGLLSGNTNIVRVPSNYTDQCTIICNAINQLLAAKEFPEIAKMVKIVTFPRDNLIIEELSGFADVRMIWGGDTTVKNIKTIEAKPRCLDISFSDRFSLCILDADSICSLDAVGLKRLANGFYNDAYIFDQNACSSPHLVLWRGKNSEIEKAKLRFWQAIEIRCKESLDAAQIRSTENFIQLCRVASCVDTARVSNALNGLVSRMELKSLPPNVDELRGNMGFFIEANDTNFDKLAIAINSKYQTITYFGFDPNLLKNFLIENGLPGVDRIVPIGNALDIDLTWDGYDLVNTMSRVISVS